MLRRYCQLDACGLCRRENLRSAPPRGSFWSGRKVLEGIGCGNKVRSRIQNNNKIGFLFNRKISNFTSLDELPFPELSSYRDARWGY